MLLKIKYDTGRYKINYSYYAYSSPHKYTNTIGSQLLITST